MKLTLAEPKYLKDSISIISELVNEGRFKINQNGIELVALDPANVAMVIFRLLSSAFVEYDVKTNIDIAINLSSLKQVLRRAKPTDIIIIEVEDGRMNITLKGDATRRFSLPILDTEAREQRIPDLVFTAKIKTSSSILNEAIEDSDIVADAVSFIAEKGILTLRADGDLNKVNVEIKQSDETNIEVDSNEKIKGKYSIEYLKKMILGSKISDNVVISFNKDYPLRLDYVVVDKVALSFILAPRVENE